ncbi:hypothetical protein SynNOUM97013_02311 [Synechococcus sp. NOUM97013]|nr:hypothetical protein SynNOUM97013_02311 [Synechococcus sp. NOUM97013]
MRKGVADFAPNLPIKNRVNRSEHYATNEFIDDWNYRESAAR